MPTTVILGTGIIGLSTAYYLARLTEDAEEPNDHTSTSPSTGTDYFNAPPQTKQRHDIHLVEASPELFASASGKAAGFLAKDWFAPAVAPLGEFSFDLHRQLAEEHGGRKRWGYSSSVSYSLDREDSDIDEDEYGERERFLIDEDSESDAEQPATSTKHAGQHRHSGSGSRTTSTDLSWLMDGSSRASLLDDATTELEGGGEEDELPWWLRARRSALQAISDTATTGQLDPHRLCQFLLEQCRARGVHLHHPARATQLLHTDAEDSSSPSAVRLEYLDPTSPAAFEEHATPNSKSPPPDAPAGTNANGLAVPQRVSRGISLTRGSPGARALNPPDSNGTSSDSPWKSFSSPLESSPESSPVRSPIDLPPSDLPNGATNGHADFALNSDGRLGADDIPDSPSAEHRQGQTVDIPCDSIVIAAGCWTPRVYRTLFPNAGRIPRVTALAGHSIVMKSAHWPPKRRKHSAKAKVEKLSNLDHDALANDPETAAGSQDYRPTNSRQSSGSSSGTLTLGPNSLASTNAPPSPDTHFSSLSLSPRRRIPRTCQAVFTSDPTGYSPEIFSRLSGDVWVGGLNTSSIPLPALPSLAIPDPVSIARLQKTADALLGTNTERISSALCFRPVAPTGRPVIARMHEADLGDGAKVPGGVFVATGHGPWGISLGLGTGYVVSEMVLGRKPSVNVKVLGTWEAQAP